LFILLWITTNTQHTDIVDLLFNCSTAARLCHSRLAIESRANYVVMLRYKSFI